jgi:hypothetical protein
VAAADLRRFIMGIKVTVLSGLIVASLANLACLANYF